MFVSCCIALNHFVCLLFDMFVFNTYHRDYSRLSVGGVVASVSGVPLASTLVTKIYENPDTTELVIPSSYPSPTLFEVGTRTEYRSAIQYRPDHTRLQTAQGQG